MNIQIRIVGGLFLYYVTSLTKFFRAGDREDRKMRKYVCTFEAPEVFLTQKRFTVKTVKSDTCAIRFAMLFHIDFHFHLAIFCICSSFFF